MGNQGSLHQGAAAGAQLPGEPLESFSKEKQRDEHLKNLGFKTASEISLDTRIEVVERPPTDKPIVGLPQPLPAHVQVEF